MALSKVIETPSGVDATYWRVGDLYRLSDNSVNIILEGYKDQQARLDNKKPLTTAPMKFQAHEKVFDYTYLNDNGQNPHERIYELVKNMSEFSGATDILE